MRYILKLDFIQKLYCIHHVKETFIFNIYKFTCTECPNKHRTQ